MQCVTSMKNRVLFVFSLGYRLSAYLSVTGVWLLNVSLLRFILSCTLIFTFFFTTHLVSRFILFFSRHSQSTFLVFIKSLLHKEQTANCMSNGKCISVRMIRLRNKLQNRRRARSPDKAHRFYSFRSRTSQNPDLRLLEVKKEQDSQTL